MTPVRINKFIDLLLHPAVLALPIALLIILFIPDIFSKYKIESISESIIDPGRRRTYCDLDKDGISEMIDTKNNDKSGSAVIIESSIRLIDQWNINGAFNLKETQIITGDANNDGSNEIYALVYRNDSLLLNGIDYRKPGEFILSDFFIADVKVDTNRTMRIYSGNLTDLNGDGYKELVFIHSSGFSKVPRKVFAVDLIRLKVNCSEELGAFIQGANFADIDNDGFDEIGLNDYAICNYKKDSLPARHDHAAYIMVLDHNLKHLFNPIEFPGTYNGCTSYPIRTPKGSFILSSTSTNENGYQKNIIQILDLKGKILKRRSFYVDRTNGSILILLKNSEGYNQILLNFINEKIVFLDSDLSTIKELNYPIRFDRDYLVDFDQDGEGEIVVFTAKPGEFKIFRHDMTNPVSASIIPPSARVIFHNVLRGKEKPHIMIQTDNRIYYFQYGFNPLYYLRVPVYLAIYLTILLFILLIRNLQRIQLKKKYETEKRMAELQLVSLRNQMDPHFTFNVLNTIGSAILQKKSKESYELLMKFSKMIRSTIHSANRVCRPLQDELDFVKNYLELQQIRHQGFFNFNIVVDRDANLSQLVPKMVLQTYIENALKHGLVPKKGGGELDVSVTKHTDCLQLSVTDNGVGRQQAKLNGSISTGVGLSIMNQYYHLLNRENTNPITEEFTDLFNADGSASGTRVVVCIPDGFVFPGVSS